MIWLFWLTFFSILSEGNRFMSEQPEAEIIDMKARAKLIQEARDARAKRKAERAPPTVIDFKNGPIGLPLSDPIPYPGGIDDMELS